MKNIKKIFTYLVVGALVIALSISCKSNEDPGSGVEGDLGSIPTASGNPATVGDVVFVGTLNRTALSGITEDEAAHNERAPATFTIPDDFQFEIVDSKISAGMFRTLQGIQLLSTSDAKVVKASVEVTDADSGTTVNESIELTLDDTANPTTAKVIYKMSSGGGGYPTVSATYEGTLTKDTSSGS